MIMLVDNNDVFNIGQLLVIPYPTVPVTMYLFGLNFQIEL